MNLLFQISKGMTFGIIIGLIIGMLRLKVMKIRKNTEAENKMNNFFKSISKPIIYTTFCILFISLIWTIYFLILGVVDPAQTEYAQNVTSLIVSVVTIFSISIAFYQFLTEKK